MIRVVVADDEPLARHRLRALLGNASDMTIVAECANGDDVVRAVEAHEPDVLLLDIQMPGLTGIQIIDALGPRAVPVVVFVTAYDAHAVKAFEQEALDYLLKPLGEERFAQTLVRVRERLARRALPAPATDAARGVTPSADGAVRTHLSRIPLRTAGKITFLEVDSLEWVEADGDYLRLHAGSRPQLYRATLTALEKQLDPAHFVRVHRSALVRRSAIVSLEPYFHGEYIIRVRSGARLRLSRTYRDRLPELLG